ncbi:flagellar motility protein MotE (MotC chaperone) [Rhodobacter viridis]|uniref:Flagellar motility protein MotE (MotC chaperone) n=2 Tax=Rhodobacter viridis TaxID=1054202 RepID=A0A318U517_9RHOB|nr:flagellar motility protein MotE (MotC chaperone) [Rhodobacter viridis]
MKTPKPPAQAVKKPRRRFGRGSLMLIAALFAASALVRFGAGIAEAVAATSSAETASADSKSDCVTEPGLMNMLSEVQDREKKLAEREKVVSDRSQALTLAEKRIEQRLASLVEAEKNLSQTVEIADKGADEDVTRLVTVYENMKPKEAAPLFSTMAPDFAAGFLSRMRPESSAAIMAVLDPKVAYTISVIMAGRNAGAPQN